jgi:hypothetical protein
MVDPLTGLAGIGLIGVTLVGIGFLLRRESEEFYRDHKEDASSMRAMFQARFRQKFAEEVSSTVEKAAGGAGTVEMKVLKEKIAEAAVEPAHESGVGTLGELLEHRDNVWKTFNEARAQKSTAAGWIIWLGAVILASSLYFLVPNPDSNSLGIVVLLVAGLASYLIILNMVTAYNEHSKASARFFKYCEEELQNL